MVLGPAGSGKTFRCITEAREDLAAAPEGPALLLIAPKQGTYQLEQQLLAERSPAGYTRLRILSFETLAHFILDSLRRNAPRILDEEGRLMVLRSLLSKERESLQLFRASAKLTGFAQQLSRVLHEFQRHQVTPQMLRQVAFQAQHSAGLAAKLRDLSTILQAYLDWLQANLLQDTDSLLSTAMASLRTMPANLPGSFRFSRVWIDGFSEFSAQELDLLAALMPHCEQATVTFCIDPKAKPDRSWLSHWAMVQGTYAHCRKRLMAVPDAEILIDTLPLDGARNRFAASPVLRHLATHWDEPLPYPNELPSSNQTSGLRVVICDNPEAEVRIAAREILRHARA